MSDITVNKGWLKDAQSNYFAPKTLISQILDSDGTSLENKISQSIDEAKNEAKTYTDGQIKDMVGDNSVAKQIIGHNQSENAHDDIREELNGLKTRFEEMSSFSEETLKELEEALDVIKNDDGTLLASISNKVDKSDIADNLTTSTTGKVLSANQGVMIQAKFDEMDETLTTMDETLADSIKSLSVSGTTITYTKNDNTTGIITTQDTNNKVTNIPNSSTKAYITGTTSSSQNTGTQIFDTNVYLGTTAGELVATIFTGNLTGDVTGDVTGNADTATTATKLGSTTMGGVQTPIYLSSGSPTACSLYAGGTKVTLNGASKGASDVSFYAPTSSGNPGQVLVSNGSGNVPAWATLTTSGDYTLPTASSTTKGGVIVGDGLEMTGTNSQVLTISTAANSGLAFTNNGELKIANPLPSVTSSNEGQFLRVVSGVWAAVTINSAESGAF